MTAGVIATLTVTLLGLAFDMHRAPRPEPQLGTAVAAPPLREDARYAQVLRQHFTSVTPENAMKFDALQPEQGTYTFQDADSIVDFAQAHGLQVRGHTLVWHRALPSWLTDHPWTREQLMAVLRAHIFTTVGRYRGRVRSWDVVNEALDDQGQPRDSLWRRVIGPDYIRLAFLWAHEADPEATLYYNDYGAEGLNAKADAVYALVKDLRDRHVPIGGVGLQMHLTLEQPPALQDIQANVRRLAALGVQVAITELEVRLGPGGAGNPAREQAQAQLYADLAGLCHHERACSGVTTWGFTDRYYWEPGVTARGDAPLPFTSEYHPKRAWDALRQALRP